MNSEKARLEHEATGFSLRLKSLDESEQRYKDENWSLETQIHEMITAAKEAASREQKVQQNLAATTAEKTTAQRELDDLKQNHGKLVEDHDASRKSHEAELAGLRRNVNLGDSERSALQKKVEELTSQNQELAKAVASRFRDGESEQAQDAISESEDLQFDPSESEHSPPPSPSKGIPRHSLLESETLKSSLHHAHRMIQNLKSNVQREKSEKLDLKRMLQEARDELDVRSRAGHESKRLKANKSQQELSKKPVRPNILGASRNSKTDVLVDDQDWEDREGSPSHRAGAGARTFSRPNEPVLSTESDAYQTANETDDGFETAEERNTATNTDAFQTGAENLAGDSSDELTETEGAINRGRTVRDRKLFQQLASAKAGDRSSFQSTASTSADDGDYQVSTPAQAQPQRYRLKINRGSRRSRIGSEPLENSTPSTVKDSPASFVGNGVQGGQSLFNELDNLNADSGDEAENTPSRSVRSHRSTPSMNGSIRSRKSSTSMRRSVSSQRSVPSGRPTTVLYNGPVSEQPPVPKLPLVDSGMMTEPWEPKPVTQSFDEPDSTAGKESDSPSTPLNIATQDQPANARDIDPATRSPSVSPRTVWDQPLQMFANIIPTFGPASLKSTPLSTKSNASREPIRQDSPNHFEASGAYPEAYAHSEPESETASPPVRQGLGPSTSTSLSNATPAPVLSFSAIQALDTIPTLTHISVTPSIVAQQPGITTATPNSAPEFIHDFSENMDREPELANVGPKQRSEQPVEAVEASSAPEHSDAGLQISGTTLGNSWAHPNGVGGILGSVFGSRKAEHLSAAQIMEDETSQDSHPLPLSINKEGKLPLEEVPPNTASRGLPLDEKPRIPPLDMTDEASQTVLSSDQIDNLLSQKEEVQMDGQLPATAVMKPLSEIGALSPPTSSNRFETGDLSKAKVREPSGVRKPSGMPAASMSKDVPTLTKSPKRPLSNASIRQRTDQYPPLPPDHQKAIAAAAQRTSDPPSTGIMGPPLAPASSYRNRTRTASRPRTPSEQQATQSPTSKGGTTPRARYSAVRSQASRRSSMSSFASEIDERFNIRLDGVPGVEAGTDPRMIQAITQTMIGEFLWKYTRKAGRGDMSSNRHRRFFWVHPYTRTLYWSDQDPSTAGRAQLKAKSVAIEAVRVVTDDNPMPPGLHRKSLVIMTPGRSVKITATTGQRHETWFNALSYLLLRTGPDGNAAGNDGYLSAEEIAEFNPSHDNNRRSRSRVSFSSWRSLSRNSNNRDLENQQTYSSRRAPSMQPPSRPQSQTPGGQNASVSSRNSVQPQPARSKSRGGSFSSRISEYWRPSNNITGSISSRHSKSSMQLAGVGSATDVAVHDSAEDLRRVIENAEREGGVENVRACCDGKPLFKFA